ncbi:MAG: flagellar hook-length control protein FliK [Rubritepida sp.]|nr:flagellar hook-length control protein FliK [Rubritepida sp.]
MPDPGEAPAAESTAAPPEAPTPAAAEGLPLGIAARPDAAPVVRAAAPEPAAPVPDVPALVQGVSEAGAPARGEGPAATAAPAAPPPPPPARQIAPVAVALAFAPALGQFRVTLEPAELGRVEIEVRRDGQAHDVRIRVERPETLALLQRDRAELDRAFADSGLSVGEGGIAFSLDGGAARDGSAQDRREGTGQPGPRRAAAGTTPGAAETPPPPRPMRGLLDLSI